MRLKDYYRVLGVPSSATIEEIRKSFRNLAMKYHPDRNPDSPFSAGHFIEIKEAYHVLSDEKRRYRYDEERWLLGMGSRSPSGGRLSAEWVRGEAARLRKHMEQIDTYRMNHEALQQYALLLLSDAHLAVMEHSILVPDLVKDVLVAIAKLKMPMLTPVTDRLMVLAGVNEAVKADILALLAEREMKEKKEQQFRMYMLFFLLVTGIAAIVILAI